jgi:hypothetical protein
MMSDVVESHNEANAEIGLLDILLILIRHKWILIGLPIIAGVVAMISALFLPNEYTATLEIAPSPNAPTYSWLLNNEQVMRDIAKELKLAEHYGTHDSAATLRKMKSHVKIVADARSGFMDISATDAVPDFAARLANSYGSALQKNLYQMHLLAASKARYESETRRSVALDNQQKFRLQIARPELASVIDQLTVADRYSITSLAGIQADSTLHEVQSETQPESCVPSGTSLCASSGVPPVMPSDLMQSELIRVKDQLNSLQRLVGSHQVSAKDIGAKINAVNALQQEAYWTELVSRLDVRIGFLKQREQGELKITAAVTGEKSGPKYKFIIAVSVLLGFFTALLYVFVYEGIKAASATQRGGAIMAQILAVWKK